MVNFKRTTLIRTKMEEQPKFCRTGRTFRGIQKVYESDLLLLVRIYQLLINARTTFAANWLTGPRATTIRHRKPFRAAVATLCQFLCWRRSHLDYRSFPLMHLLSVQQFIVSPATCRSSFQNVDFFFFFLADYKLYFSKYLYQLEVQARI